MLLACAPLEGVTGYIFRSAHAAVFGPADRYYAPFFAPNQHLCLAAREKRDLIPAHNTGLCVIPQVLTNDPDQLLWAGETVAALGYPMLNLNLGCPAPTVTTKGRGAGLLGDPDRLDRLLDAVCGKLAVPLSVKTRLGLSDPVEFDRLLTIFNRYPLTEVIVHARVRDEFYRGAPHPDAFAQALTGCRHPIWANGDLFTPAACQAQIDRTPDLAGLMCGRGLVADPALFRRLRGGAPASREELRAFHDRILEAYQTILSGDAPLLCRMKELWFYLHVRFSGTEKPLKQLRKARRLSDYRTAADALLALPLAPDGFYQG